MKREILFSGKRLDNHDWTYGDLMQDRDLGTACISGWDYYVGETGIEREPFLYEVDSDTIGQFTGMFDKNRRRIFDGDIMWNCEPNKELYVISWEHRSAAFMSKKFINRRLIAFEHINYEYCDFIEIIGNIYDNPELLEVKS